MSQVAKANPAFAGLTAIVRKRTSYMPEALIYVGSALARDSLRMA